jgi:hypothetical protein
MPAFAGRTASRDESAQALIHAADNWMDEHVGLKSLTESKPPCYGSAMGDFRKANDYFGIDNS